MSQLVACILPKGLLIAADRRVVVGDGPEAEVHALRKLFPLGSSAALATSGAAVGLAVSRLLSRLLEKRPPLPLAELEAYALSVFQKEYDAFIRRGGVWFTAHPYAHRLSYLLLGGRQADGSFTFRFHASEAHGEPYRPLPTGQALTAPRRLGLESRLVHAIAANACLEDVRDLAVAGLRLIAQKENSVAGPFDIALLDDSGLRLEEIDA